MTPAEIPSQTLAEAYRALAERRGVNSAALDRQSVNESEFLAALAYVLGIPLIETQDLGDALLSDCRALTAELESDALMDYQFVPMARRGETLIVISSCPWDSVATEVLLGYFQPCACVKFVLASPACLRELLTKLKPAESKASETALPDQMMRSSSAKAAIPQPPSSAAQPRERAPAPVSTGAPIVLPPGARPALKTAARNSPPAQPDGRPLLTTDDITHLMNVLAGEIHRLTQQKSQRSL
jgi:hypothetical protein